MQAHWLASGRLCRKSGEESYLVKTRPSIMDGLSAMLRVVSELREWIEHITSIVLSLKASLLMQYWGWGGVGGGLGKNMK